MGEAIGGILMLSIIIFGAMWVFCTCKSTVQSVGRTGKAIGKWNDEKLGK